MNRSNGPISPLSMNSASSGGFASRFGSQGGSSGPPPTGGTPNDVPYAGGPYGAARPSQTSPPGSQRPSGSTDASRPSVASSGGMRPPSSASSLGGRSDGRMGFGGPGARDSGRSTFQPESEEALQRHYHVLKGYLNSSLRDEKGNLKPNRARDKLLRLSVTQFMELSTDVFDELVRREDDRLQRVKDVPNFLLPKPMFHPKRNQARQKLSTLPIERFRQLATDVFYELERRIPRFTGGDIDRPQSTTSNGPGGPRAPSRGGMRPPPPGYRGPPPPGGPGRPPLPSPPNGMRPPNMPYQSFRPNSPGPNGPAGPPPPGPMRRPSEQSSESGSLGRPLPKTFQSNTIVPNKSTMVEDDDEEDEDTFGLDKGVRYSESPRLSEGLGGGSEKDKETIKTQEAEIARLKERVEDLEARFSDKERDLETARSGDQDREDGMRAERDEWYSLREELQQKVMDAQNLHDNVRDELEMLRRNKTQDELDIHEEHGQSMASVRAQLDSLQDENADLRAQLDNHHTQNGDLQEQLQTYQSELEEFRSQARTQSRSLGSEDQERRLEVLERDLATQEKLTNDVRQEAHLYLQEMRDLSLQNDRASEREEMLETQVAKLEADNETWRQRYARVKAQNKSLRASTLGLSLPNGSGFNDSAKQSLISSSGLVRDTDLTRFQLAIDELLITARGPSTPALLASVKQTTLCVSALTSVLGTEGYPTPSPSPGAASNPTTTPDPSAHKLRARALASANALITAAKQHASASGLSPVALLDAAASNLTASVLDLVKILGIRASSASELQDPDLNLPEPQPNGQSPAAEIESLYSSSTSADLARTRSLDAAVAAMPLPPGSSGGAKDSGGGEVKPLNLLGRSDTKKKANGWFGWGRGTGDEDEDEVPVPVPVQGAAREEEYDPYR